MPESYRDAVSGGGNADGGGGVAEDVSKMEMKTITLAGSPRRGGTRSMARNELRPIVKLRSTAGTGYTYVTRKNRRNDPDRLSLRKYDPRARMHVLFREER
jgi:large subunit ribosomal protein L33